MKMIEDRNAFQSPGKHEGWDPSCFQVLDFDFLDKSPFGKKCGAHHFLRNVDGSNM